MRFVGFPTVADMQEASRHAEQINSVVVSSFFEYVMTSIQRFSGINVTPRLISKVLTQKYMIFYTRRNVMQDSTDITNVAEQFRQAGFYVEIENSTVAKSSNTMSFLISWDPIVLQNENAKIIFGDNSGHNEYYEFYLVVMQYIRAESSLLKQLEQFKEPIRIDNISTIKWVNISILSNDMYQSALAVCKFLSNYGYYVGIVSNSRRNNTWTLIVSWDERIKIKSSGPEQNFKFVGELPKSWV